MIGSDLSTLAIIPLTLPNVDYPSAHWMVYGDTYKPRAEYDVIHLTKNSRPLGHFVFHPDEGGLLWAGHASFQRVRGDTYLRHDGQPIAAVSTAQQCSFLMFLLVLAPGVEVRWYGDFNLKPLHLQNWRQALEHFGWDMY